MEIKIIGPYSLNFDRSMSFDRQLIGTVLGSESGMIFMRLSFLKRRYSKYKQKCWMYRFLSTHVFWSQTQKKPSASHVDISYLLTFFLQRGPLQFVALYLRCQLSCGTIVQRHSRGIFNTEKLLYFTEKIWRNLEGKDKKIENDLATLNPFLAK